MSPTLDSLLLTKNELKAAKKRVQEMAYAKWQAAGCPAAGSPADDAREFWREAELEWIEYYYVPKR